MGRYIYIPDDDDGPPDPPQFEPITVEFWQASEVPALVAEGKPMPLFGLDQESVVGRIVAGRPEGDGCILSAEITDPTMAFALAAPTGSFSIDRGQVHAVPADSAG
jgi:hypothetical protein